MVSLDGNQIFYQLLSLVQAQIQKQPRSQHQEEMLVKCVREIVASKAKPCLFILASTKSVKRVGKDSPIKLVPSDLIRELAKYFF